MFGSPPKTRTAVEQMEHFRNLMTGLVEATQHVISYAHRLAIYRTVKKITDVWLEASCRWM